MLYLKIQIKYTRQELYNTDYQHVFCFGDEIIMEMFGGYKEIM